MLSPSGIYSSEIFLLKIQFLFRETRVGNLTEMQANNNYAVMPKNSAWSEMLNRRVYLALRSQSCFPLVAPERQVGII